jgi:rod shape-determining protein MreD
MHLFRIAIFSFILVLLETTFLPVVAVNGIRPDLAFVYVLFLAFYSTPTEGFLAFWLVGLVKDLFSAGPLGAYALIYAAYGYELSGLTQKLFRENPVTQIVLALPSAFIVNGVYLLAMVFAYYPQIAVPVAARSAFICAVYTAAITPPLLFLMARVQPLVGIRPQPPLGMDVQEQAP